MDADEKLNTINMKIKYYDTTLKYLEEIIRIISNRTYQIKNAIEWNNFKQVSINGRRVTRRRKIPMESELRIGIRELKCCIIVFEFTQI